MRRTTRAKKHTHKYEYLRGRWISVWRCALPDCSHYMPQHIEAMVCGKASICWGCGVEFLLNEDNMKSDRPKCDDCIDKENTIVNDPNKLIEAMKQGIL